jgi:hypothetical protein
VLGEVGGGAQLEPLRVLSACCGDRSFVSSAGAPGVRRPGGHQQSSLRVEQLALGEPFAGRIDVLLADAEHVERLTLVAGGEPQIGEEDVEQREAEPGS